MYEITKYPVLKEIMTKDRPTMLERFNYLEGVIEVLNIKKTYGKKIFKDLEEREIYLFTETKMVKVTFQPFMIKSYNLNDIINVELELINRYENSLKVSFRDETIIDFKNTQDSNEAWADSYYDFIIEIARYLLNL